MKLFFFLLLFPITLFSQEDYFNKLIDSLPKIKKTEDKVQLYVDISWEYALSSNDSALIYANKALELSKESNYYFGEVISLETKGVYNELVTGDYDKALALYLEGIQLCEDHHLDYATSIYHSIGVMFHTSDNYKKAKKYYEIAYERALDENKIEIQKKCLINLGAIYSSLKDYQKAEELLLKSLEINTRQALDFDTYANLGNLYYRQGGYEEALPYIEKSCLISDDNFNSEANLSFLINVKVKLKDTNEMKGILERAISFIDHSNSIRRKSIMLMSVSNYYRMIGDYEKALNFRDDYLELYEKIKEKQRDETVYELEASFQNEKKEREIAEQKLVIKEKNQLLFGSVLLGLLLIAMIFFLRKRYLYHETINQQKEEISKKKIEALQQEAKLIALHSVIEGQEKERLRIAKDLHDSLGGLLSSVKTHFSTMTNQCSDVKEMELTKKTNLLIDNACVEVRRISHNMMPHALRMSGLKGAIEDLGEQLSVDGYDVSVEISYLPENIDETKKITIYRLFQELISNIKKHSNAKKVLLQIVKHENQLMILVEDDGKGFDYKKMKNSDGIGVKSINSRVEFLNGTIHWDTVINGGTSVTINIPI